MRCLRNINIRARFRVVRRVTTKRRCVRFAYRFLFSRVRLKIIFETTRARIGVIKHFRPPLLRSRRVDRANVFYHKGHADFSRVWTP